MVRTMLTLLLFFVGIVVILHHFGCIWIRRVPPEERKNRPWFKIVIHKDDDDEF